MPLLQARQRNLLRKPDFSSQHIIQPPQPSFSRRNTVEEAAEQAVVDTAVVVAPEVAGQVAAELAEAPVAGQVEELAEAPAAVRVVVPAVALAEAPVAVRAVVPGPARQEASADTAIRLTIRRGRLFRNFPHPLLPISR
jgi:hypothetical protein